MKDLKQYRLSVVAKTKMRERQGRMTAGQLEDINHVIAVMQGIARLAEMDVMSINAVPVDNPVTGDKGVSVGLLIVQSHIYIHTWPELGKFWFDLVSCKPFDAIKIGHYLDECFNVESWNEGAMTQSLPMKWTPQWLGELAEEVKKDG